MTAYTNRQRRSYNIKDGRPRRRTNTAQRFEDAGFKLISHNQFELQSYGQTFAVLPSWVGLKVVSETMHEPQIFPFGTKPEIIADWIVGYARIRHEDWLTANLPPTKDDPNQDNAPQCYGLGKGEY